MKIRLTSRAIVAIVRHTFNAIDKLREAGHKEYVHDDSRPFRNFEDTGSKMGVSRYKAWYLMASKHWDGVTAYVGGHQSQREDVEGRINDLIMYLILLKAMVMEDKGVVIDGATATLEQMDMFDSSSKDVTF